MTALDTARAHLAKAEEFLAEADGALDRGSANVATSDAVTAGINAKDAICLALVGQTTKSGDHGNAVAELRRAGPAGADLVATLDRLMKPKTTAQYQATPVSASDAEVAVRQARRLVEGARKLLRR
jgi:hypothetical protein